MSKKNKSNPARPRFAMNKVEITDKEINPNTGNVEVSIIIDAINGTNKLINNYTGEIIENSGISYGYKGENKWRVTSEINSEKDDYSLCFNCKFKRFKHIVAIDTNLGKYQSKIGNQEIWIGLGIAITLIDNDDDQKLEPLMNMPFVTSICPEKPENENWVRVIEILKENCKCTDPRKIGIVVDSDLGNIPAYNKREKPILGEYFLPEGFELIFASDKVSDNIFNSMIKLSHSLSQELIPKLIESCVKSEEEIIKKMNKK